MAIVNPAIAQRATIGALAATTVVIADMIGIGVFTSLGFQVVDITSGFSVLLLWLVGGVVALCGALCYAELAAMFPRSSGEYNFLSRSYHPALGFMAGWLSATMGFAAPVALASMAFGHYAKSVVPDVPPLALGLAIIWIVTLVHMRGVRDGSALQVSTTVLKLLLILAFIGAGFGLGARQPISFEPSAADAAQIFSAPFAISLVFVMYSYSGWNAATYIIGEIRKPHSSLPLALLSGTLIVMVLYLALNAVFLYTTPLAALAGRVDVAVAAGIFIFGERGSQVVGLIISLGLISSISAMTWIGPRVAMTMGEDFPILGVFARRSANGTPWIAIMCQAIIASVLFLTGSFEAVLEFIQFGLLCCSFLSVLGVIKLRLTRPDLPRPYRAWGYPVTPLIFLSVITFTLYYLAVTRPLQSIAGFMVMLLGLVLYVLAASHAAHDSVKQVTIPK
jgi:basic amino acid/polyamine antiporter, APA family